MTAILLRRASPRRLPRAGRTLLRAIEAVAFGTALAAVAAFAALAPPSHAQADAAGHANATRAAASADSPVGLWRNIDDETKQPKALIRISENGGVYVGRIEKILTDKPDAVCDRCTDERKDQPVQGMQIIDGMRANPEQPGLYEGGRILDPNNGKVYRSQMRVVDGGERLEVRGYIGAPLFGRTQTWIRER